MPGEKLTGNESILARKLSAENLAAHNQLQEMEKVASPHAPVVSQPENSGCLELTSAVSQSHRHFTIEGETAQVQLDLNKLSPKGGIEQSSILVENCEDSDVVCARCLKRGSRTELHRCAGCKSFSYCTKDCQISDWPSHKQLCKSIHLNDPKN